MEKMSLRKVILLTVGAVCLVLTSHLAGAAQCALPLFDEPEVLGGSDNSPSTFLGHYTKIDDDVIVTGAYGYDEWRGAVFVFESSNGRFQEKQMLTAPRGQKGDHLGLNVDTAKGMYVVAGAPYSKRGGKEIGRAYVWERLESSSWTLASILMEPNPTVDARFGYSVSMTGKFVLVGARYATNEEIGLEKAGTVYIYKGAASDLTLQQTLSANVPDMHFGDELVLKRGLLALGVPRQRDGEGGASLYELSTSDDFVHAADLIHEPPEGTRRTDKDHFGEGLAINYDSRIVVVGGERAQSPGCSNTGAAYVFEKQLDGSWLQIQGLFPLSCGDSRFAQRVAIHDEVIAVGAWTSGELGNKAGSLYIYTRCADSGRYELLSHELLPNGMPGDEFGKSVDISRKYLVVGAPKRDSAEGDVANAGNVLVYPWRSDEDDSQDSHNGGYPEGDHADVIIVPVSTLSSSEENTVQVRYFVPASASSAQISWRLVTRLGQVLRSRNITELSTDNWITLEITFSLGSNVRGKKLNMFVYVKSEEERLAVNKQWLVPVL